MTDPSKLSDSELMAAAALPSMVERESNGRPGALGPQTRYGRAEGMTQMLPATAQATAQRIGMPWQPELMTGTSPEAADYQMQLGRAYLQEGIETTGNLQDGLRYYHGGPDRRQWGPKTEDYAQSVYGSALEAPEAAPATPGGLSDEDLMALAGPVESEVRHAQPMPRAPGDLPQRTPAKSGVPFVQGVMANLNASIPLGDELVSGLNTAGGVVSALARGQPVSLPRIGERFKGEMAAQRTAEAGGLADNPIAANLAKGTGLAASLLVPAGASAQVMANGSRGVNALRGAVSAAGTGALYAATDRGSAAERLAAASKATYDPLTLALGAGAGALAHSARRPRQAPAPTVDELQTATRAAYQAADATGARYTPAAFDQLATDLRTAAARDRLNPGLHERSSLMLDAIDNMRGNPISLTELDQLRQIIRRDVGTADDAEGHFGRMMINHIDDLIENASPAQMVSGSGPEAAQAIRHARDMNTRYRKVQDVTNRVESADLRAGSTYSGGNRQNATRQNLRPLIDPKSPQRMRNATPDEEAALNRAVRGTPAQNVTRYAGAVLRNKFVQAGIGTTLALPTKGISLGLIPAMEGAGHVLRGIGERQTTRNVQDIIDLMARGAPPNRARVPAAVTPTAEAVARLPRAAGANTPVQPLNAPVDGAPMRWSDGSVSFPDGTIRYPDGTVYRPPAQGASTR